MEARIARLESDVGHLCSDVAEIKVDVRGLRDRIDDMGIRLNAKIDAMGAQLNARIDGLTEQLASAKTWGLMLYATGSPGVLALAWSPAARIAGRNTVRTVAATRPKRLFDGGLKQNRQKRRV